ncbi:MAG: hypothetical protein CM15mP103_02730 [Gammaproteobacteria bacterium]|nr:MAG: hypothetical protein CM15mP103_02730 [Gammaproteobacteria bacterium]
MIAVTGSRPRPNGEKNGVLSVTGNSVLLSHALNLALNPWAAFEKGGPIQPAPFDSVGPQTGLGRPNHPGFVTRQARVLTRFVSPTAQSTWLGGWRFFLRPIFCPLWGLRRQRPRGWEQYV